MNLTAPAKENFNIYSGADKENDTHTVNPNSIGIDYKTIGLHGGSQGSLLDSRESANPVSV